MRPHCPSKVVLFACCCILLFSAATSAIAVTPNVIYKQSLKSLVVIVSQDENSQPIKFGSGFFIDANLVATNFHVISRAAKLKVFDASSRDELGVEGIYAIEPDHDLAILRLRKSGPPLTLSTKQVEVGDSVFALGNPRGLEGTLSTGIVSAIRQLDVTTLYQITAPISPGSSGGPVLNESGQLVGIATSYLQEGQNLNFAVAVNHLEELSRKGIGQQLQSLALLLTTPQSKREKVKTALESVRVTGSQAHGDSDDEAFKEEVARNCEPLRARDYNAYSDCYRRAIDSQLHFQLIEWQFSILNEGDRAIKNPRLLILIFDEHNDLIHFVQKDLQIAVPPHLAKRTTMTEHRLTFSTYHASNWKYQYRILGFDYME